MNSWWKLFVAIVVILLGLFWGARETMLWLSAERERAYLRGSIARELDATAVLLDEQSRFVQEMVRVMARDADLLGWVTTPDPSRRDSLQQRWIALSEQFQIFNQIRFLSPVGQELIRVDYDRVQATAQVAPRLQYKGGRPYFLHAMGLAEGEVMFSRIDLNMEHGQITVPYMPTIRVITPVFTADRLQGYLVVNLSMDTYTAILSQVETALGEQPWIVNHDGYFIKSSNPEQEWGMLIPDRMHHNLHDLYPVFWQQMMQLSSGELMLHDRQQVLFKRIALGQSPEGSHWAYLITPLNKALITERISPIVSILNWVMLIGFVCSGFIAMQLASYWSARNQRRQAQTLAQAALASMSGVMITDPRGTIHTINAAFTEITGYDEVDALGRKPRFLSSGDHDAGFYRQLKQQLRQEGYWKGVIWNLRRNGDRYPQLTTIKALRDNRGQLEHYVANFTDLTAQKQLEDQLRKQAETDPLTGLYNRRRFEQVLQHELALSRRYGQPFCIALMDADHFKRINDSFGHDVGDAVLQYLAAVGLETLRETDTIARWGGEEYILLLPRTQAEGAGLVVERLRRLIASNQQHPGLSCSFGLAQWRPGDDIASLLQRADKALYGAKSAGRNQVIRAA